MKHTLTAACLMITAFLSAQSKLPSAQQFFLDSALQKWMISFSNIHASGFVRTGTQHFENVEDKNFDQYERFVSLYKPLLTYSPYGSQFIDIYSYQLNIERKGNSYVANPQAEQAIYLCNANTKYWKRIYFTGSTVWIEEVAWLSDTTFVLAGAESCSDDKRKPVLMIGHTVGETFEKFSMWDKYVNRKSYISPALKKMRIKGI
ncbi:MAG: hypothetical protein QM802_21250 [Agriterribacter sp.]